MDHSTAAISVKEAAKQLNISERQIHRMIGARIIASVKIGKRRLITPEAIQEVIRKHQIIAR